MCIRLGERPFGRLTYTIKLRSEIRMTMLHLYRLDQLSGSLESSGPSKSTILDESSGGTWCSFWTSSMPCVASTFSVRRLMFVIICLLSFQSV